MTMNPASLKLEQEGLASALQRAGENLDGTEGDVILDFSFVRRINPPALIALTEFANMAHEKHVVVTLQGVNVDVYRVLKLSKLAHRFSLVN